MLFADKRALQTNLKLGLLEIREKELNFYTNNCMHLGFLASIFAGFASAALTTTVEKEPLVLHAAYLLVTCAALGLQLCALISTTLLAMLAPGLALRGPDGSMNRSIDSMIGEYRNAFFQLLLGLFALHLSCALYVWLSPQISSPQAILLNIAIACALSFELRYIRRIMGDFQLPSTAAVTGKFEGTEARRAGAMSGLKDRREIGTISHLIQQQSAGGGGCEASDASWEADRGGGAYSGYGGGR